jgi:hypothetical protein
MFPFFFKGKKKSEESDFLRMKPRDPVKQIRLIVLTVLLSLFMGTQVSSKEIAIGSLLPKDLLEGWTRISGPQVYTQKTLFEHTDGQAEIFLQYGFQKSVFAIYQNGNNSKDQIELDLYDMGNVLQAFGIFSRFRSEDRPAGVGLESNLEESSLLFYKGRYFVMLYATETGASILKKMGITISSGIPDSSPAPKEIELFPKKGLKPGSIQYYPEGLLGYQFLKRGFQGIYVGEDQGRAKHGDKSQAKGEDKEYYLFLVISKDSKELENTLNTFRDTLSKKGNVELEASTPFGSKALKGEDPYRGKILLVPKGNYLLGAAGFKDDKEAENRLAEFIKNMR